MKFRILGLSLFLMGCSVKPVVIEPEFNLARRDQDARLELGADHCVSFEDIRDRYTAHYKILSPESAENWIEEALAELSIGKVHFVNDETSQLTELPPVIQLHKAYVKHLMTSMSGVVVLSFNHQGQQLLFRGQSVKVNWIGGKGEYENALNSALVDAAGTMLNDEQVVDEILHSSC